MAPDLLVLSAAFLSGLLGSVHCLAMCAGLASGLASVSAPAGRQTLAAAIQLNLGRIGGYTAAGALVGSFGLGVTAAIDVERVGLVLRMLVGAVLVLVGLRLLDRRDRLPALSRFGQQVWARLSPVSRHLLPAHTVPRRLLLGALWGWMPCGLSWTMLLAALFTVDSLNGALLMLAFGLGTLPAMLPLTWGSGALARRLAQSRTRAAFASLVLLAGMTTLAAPWLMQIPMLHGMLEALGCRSLIG